MKRARSKQSTVAKGEKKQAITDAFAPAEMKMENFETLIGFEPRLTLLEGDPWSPPDMSSSSDYAIKPEKDPDVPTKEELVSKAPEYQNLDGVQAEDVPHEDEHVAQDDNPTFTPKSPGKLNEKTVSGSKQNVLDQIEQKRAEALKRRQALKKADESNMLTDPISEPDPSDVGSQGDQSSQGGDQSSQGSSPDIHSAADQPSDTGSMNESVNNAGGGGGGTDSSSSESGGGDPSMNQSSMSSTSALEEGSMELFMVGMKIADLREKLSLPLKVGGVEVDKYEYALDASQKKTYAQLEEKLKDHQEILTTASINHPPENSAATVTARYTVPNVGGGVPARPSDPGSIEEAVFGS